MRNYLFTSSDKALTDGLRQGDRNAFAQIYKKYWHRLFLVVVQRLKHREIAEELVQELFIKLWKKRESIEITHLESYLYAAIKCAIIDHIRSQIVQDRYKEHCRAFNSLIDLQTEEQIACHDLSTALDKGIDTLPEKTREVFRLSRLENWSIAKIALHLQLSEKAVEYHLTKSLKTLRIHLKEFMLAVFFLLF